MNVLIIEDDPMVDFIHRNYLEKLALFDSIISSESLKEAWSALSDFTIDLILLDIHIKDGNGIAFLEDLRTRHQPSEVIIISAANDGHIIRDGFHLGIIDYLIKPFTFERFEESIQQFLAHRSQLAHKELQQVQIDQLKSIGQAKQEHQSQLLEKGLSEDTLALILATISAFKHAFTIQDLCQATHLSHVSVRKYIAYLEEKKQLDSQQIYTKVGRPYRVYYKKEN
ncbi:response regulator [Streptococcus ictaluri]|uniref:Transcriptional regulatory protein n=1 Tax=Streptococcus ictaluri 707-05 TaxID=764299 RepID=G5K3G9_9STRE|nr:response regulator [Streptococcus ictaluri]EHI69682.1 response regulator receiver domain protein [Streptococcus ictaluri 707-05]